MEKINIAELLRDCPKGMELDCMLFNKVTFETVTNCGIWINYIDHNNIKSILHLTSYGEFDNGDIKTKCIIFPKGKTTWEGFHRQFKDGDIVTYEYENGLVSMILKKFVNFVEIHHHCALYDNAKGFVTNNYIVGEPKYTHLATEEEKQKLFQAIKDSGYRWNSVLKTLEKLPIFNDGDIIYNRFHKVIGIYHSKEDESPCVSHCRYNEFHKTFEILNEDLHIAKQDYRLASNDEKQKFFDVIKAHGYKWNPEVKTLEKLHKFKVGNRVKHISAHTPGVVLKVGDKGYYIDLPKNGGVRYISFELEKDYELLPNKFDINTLVPFESRVLVRDTKEEKWKPSIWGYYDANNTEYYPYEIVGGNCFCFCIPYEDNQHLLGTTNDCDDFYKTWEKQNNNS